MQLCSCGSDTSVRLSCAMWCGRRRPRDVRVRARLQTCRPEANYFRAFAPVKGRQLTCIRLGAPARCNRAWPSTVKVQFLSGDGMRVISPRGSQWALKLAQSELLPRKIAARRQNSPEFFESCFPEKTNSKASDRRVPPTRAQTTSIFSPTSFFSFSSVPVSSKEFVSTALPFSTLVMTYEQPNQCASARSVCDHWAGCSGWEW